MQDTLYKMYRECGSKEGHGLRTMIDVSDDANVSDFILISLQLLQFLGRYERHSACGGKEKCL